MWPFRKKNRQDYLSAEQVVEQSVQAKKKKTRIDKLIMGAIIGVAVGSVVGMAVHAQSPAKKHKTGILKRLFQLIINRKSHKIDPLKKIPRERVEHKE